MSDPTLEDLRVPGQNFRLAEWGRWHGWSYSEAVDKLSDDDYGRGIERYPLWLSARKQELSADAEETARLAEASRVGGPPEQQFVRLHGNELIKAELFDAWLAQRVNSHVSRFRGNSAGSGLRERRIDG